MAEKVLSVHAKEVRDRQEIVLFLEKHGYELDKAEQRSKEEIIGYFLPIIVNLTEKTFKMMGNVTCAAAASSKGCIMDKDEFYKIFLKVNDINPKGKKEGMS